MTAEELDEIERRAGSTERGHWVHTDCAFAKVDVPALVAEVRRLRKAIETECMTHCEGCEQGLPHQSVDERHGTYTFKDPDGEAICTGACERFGLRKALEGGERG